MHKRLLMFVVVAVAALPLHGGTAHSQQGSQPRNPPAQKGASASMPESGDVSLQRERLEFDKQKFASDLDIENKKLEIEREKIRAQESASIWSALSAVGPVTIALATLAFSIWSFRTQARQQAAMQLDAAKLQFEIKAAEIAFSRETARAVKSRARALKVIFPDRLPNDFTKDFDPTDFGANKEPSEDKKFFLELLLKNPENQAEVFDLWTKLFPGDEQWLDRVRTLYNPAQAIPPAAPTTDPTGAQHTT